VRQPIRQHTGRHRACDLIEVRVGRRPGAGVAPPWYCLRIPPTSSTMLITPSGRMSRRIVQAIVSDSPGISRAPRGNRMGGHPTADAAAGPLCVQPSGDASSGAYAASRPWIL